jgi:TRAP-type C4-dicarboxylate transport system substrate-binding protein
MRSTWSLTAVRTVAAVVCGVAVMMAVPERPRAADGDKTYVMKLGTATINDSQHEWIKMFVAAVEKASGGRIKGEIYPASQLGSIPREIEGVQFGSIQGWIGPPEFLVGVDERFEVMSAPGLFTSLEQANRVIADPAVQKMVMGFGANKGLHGVSLFAYGPSSVGTRKPVRHLAEFKGLKLRVLASPFQNELVSRMGGTPIAMTLGDVLPALQQGAIDGTISAMPVFTTMHYYDAAKYVTDTGQPFIFSVAEISKKWFDSLPADLQKIVTDEGAKTGKAIEPWALKFFAEQRKAWTANGGELIQLPAAEQAEFIKRISNIGDDMSKSKPGLNEAFKSLAAAVAKAK